jgi:hypothetical protein
MTINFRININIWINCKKPIKIIIILILKFHKDAISSQIFFQVNIKYLILEDKQRKY